MDLRGSLTGIFSRIGPIASKIVDAGAGFGSEEYPALVEKRVADQKRHEQLLALGKNWGIPPEQLALLPPDAKVEDMAALFMPQYKVTNQGQLITQVMGQKPTVETVPGYVTPPAKISTYQQAQIEALRNPTPENIAMAETLQKREREEAEYKARLEARFRPPERGVVTTVVGPEGKPVKVMVNPRTGKPIATVGEAPPSAIAGGRLTTIVNPDDKKPHRVMVDAQGKVIADLGEAPVTGAGATGDEADDIANAIIDGNQPPVTTGLYRFAGPVRAKLAEKGFNLSAANRDWNATLKHVSTLNGQQQERLRQAITFTYDSMDLIDELYSKWTALGGAGGMRVFNKVALFKAKQMPGELGAVAQTLELQIADLVSELATVYKAGNSSTNESLKLAATNLSKDWNEETFKKATAQIRKNLQIRRNSILQSQPAGASADNPYAAEAPAAVQPKSGPIKVRRKADGAVGTIDSEDEFDPAIYEKVP